MKKLLIILMVVAMASFLFVGCIPTVPVAVTGVTLDKATMTLTAGGATGTLVATVAPADASNTSVTWSSSAMAVATVVNGVVTPLTEGTTTITVTTVDGSFTATCAVTVTPAVVPTSDPPVMTDVQTSAGVSIFDVTSTATLYMNAAQADTSILVTGTNAPFGSSVQIYLDDVAIAGAVGEALETGLWTVAVAESSLGDDGAGKVLHATATEVGLDESEASNSVTFTLDTVAPGIDSVAATAFADSSIDSALVAGNILFADVKIDSTSPTTLTAGTWTIHYTGDSEVVFSHGTTSDTLIYNPNIAHAGLTIIPGVTFELRAGLASGDKGTITTTIVTDDRATLEFSEDVSSTDALAGTYTINGAAAVPDVYKEVNDTCYWLAPVGVGLAVGGNVTFVVSDVDDLAGNTITALSTASCAAGPASDDLEP